MAWGGDGMPPMLAAPMGVPGGVICIGGVTVGITPLGWVGSAVDGRGTLAGQVPVSASASAEANSPVDLKRWALSRAIAFNSVASAGAGRSVRRIRGAGGSLWAMARMTACGVSPAYGFLPVNRW